MRRHAKIVTAVMAMLFCLTTLPLTRADAAGDYKVKETRVDDVVYYSVYSNTDESNENHFYTSSKDVYDSTGAYSCTLTFYHPFQSVDWEQADALARYLANQMQIEGYVGFSRYGESFYWVYMIEGWDPGDSVYNLEDAGPWSNMAGESCSATVIGRGNLVSETLSGPSGYSIAAWFPQFSPSDGMTVGFSFGSGD